MQTRDRLVLALDVDDMVEALRLAKPLQPYFTTAKVGLELFSAAGPDAVTAVANLGYDIFLDLKLHDIPTTVRKSARVIGAMGARYLTLHARSGPVMLRAGVEGLAEGAERAGLAHPVALAVAVLTSDGDAPAHILGHRVMAAVEAGCGGLILAAADVHEAKQLAPRLLAVVPGIRMPTSEPHDQARPATPV
ncbi:MAG: orotidine-5'-phosphate decarboxylase, partial [Acidimicrobiales bacterium]